MKYYGEPSIHIINPFKENLCIVGMGQDGKTNFLKWLLSITRSPYTLFDSIGVVSRNFKPLNPETQKVVKPANASQRERLFLETCHEVWAAGNQIFAVDEMSMHQTKWVMPPELDTLINQGGNRNVGYWFTTRRIAQIHNDIIASAHHHVIFRTYLPQDVEWYCKVVPKDVILMSQKLPKYHFIYYQLGGESQVFKPCKDMT